MKTGNAGWLKKGRVRFTLVVPGGKGWLGFNVPMRPQWPDFPLKTIMDLKGEDCVKKLADAGFNLVWLDYSYGAGPTKEKEAKEEAKEFIRLCHEYDIRVLLYDQFAYVFWDSFLADFPQAINWFCRDERGNPIKYIGADYWFRYAICLRNRKFIEYQKDVIKEMLLDAKADGVCVDNIYYLGCYCDLCQAAFRNYLRQRFSPQDLKRVFGAPSLEQIRLPSGTDIHSRLTRERVRFHIEHVNSVLREYQVHVKSLNPEAIITGNTANPLFQPNPFLTKAMDLYSISEIFDMIYIEEIGMVPRVEFLLGKPYVLSTVRDYKYALACAEDKVVAVESVLKSRIRTPQLYETPSPRQIKRNIAEGAACGGYGTVSFSHEDTIITTPETEYLLATVKSYNTWLKKHEEDFVDLTSSAIVGIFRSDSTLTWDWESSISHLTDFEQVLIWGHIPYDTIVEKNLEKRLGKYKVLILPNVTCLSDNDIRLILDFVHQGGGLVVTGNTATYNEDFEKREVEGLMELTSEPEQAKGKVIKEFGKGRVVYYPQMAGVSPTYRRDLGWPGSSTSILEFPSLPLNWQDLLASVKWAVGEELKLEVEGPGYIFVNIFYQETSRRMFLHLVNFSDEVVTGIKVKVQIAEDHRPREITLFSPDFKAEPEILVGSENNGRIVFKIPMIDVYTMVGVQF